MNLTRAIEGGLAGASTLTLLQQALQRINPDVPQLSLMGKPGIIRKIRKYTRKGKSTKKLYIQLASEILSATAYFGITALGKKKNAPLRGALLGLGAGLAATLLEKEGSEDEQKDIGQQLLTIASYSGAGALAGLTVRKRGKNTSKK